MQQQQKRKKNIYLELNHHIIVIILVIRWDWTNQNPIDGWLVCECMYFELESKQAKQSKMQNHFCRREKIIPMQ